MIDETLDKEESESIHVRKSIRTKETISYKMPPLDPFKDSALLASAHDLNPIESISNHGLLLRLQSGKYSLDNLLKESKADKRKSAKYDEMNDHVGEVSDEEDTEGVNSRQCFEPGVLSRKLLEGEKGSQAATVNFMDYLLLFPFLFSFRLS